MLHPLPWYIAGPLVGLIVPALLLAGNKAFGISSNFRHICAAVAPCGLEFFRHDWKRTGLWNLTFLAGVCTAAALAAHLAPPTVQISARTIEALRGLGVHDFAGLAPHDVFAWTSLLTLRGFICIIAGGFLVGFGTAYAGGCTHPAPRRCSSVKYARYSPSSRLAGRAPRRPRCDNELRRRDTRIVTPS